MKCFRSHLGVVNVGLALVFCLLASTATRAETVPEPERTPAAQEAPPAQAPPTTGDTPSPAPDEDDADRRWRFSYTPYVWILDKKLTIGTPDYRRESETTFWEALKEWEWGAKLHLELENGRWGVFVDMQAVRLVGYSRAWFLKVRRDIQQFIGDAVGFRRFHFGDDHRLDVLGGVRYMYLDANVDVQFIRTFNDIFTWTDPLVGLRYDKQLHRRWRVETRADISGFGLGSDLTWQVSGQLFWRIGKSRELTVGYRHLEFDYSRNGFRYESTVDGPFFGLRHEF